MDFPANFGCVPDKIGGDSEVNRSLWFEEVNGDVVRQCPEIVLIEQGVDCHLDLDVLADFFLFAGFIISQGDFSIFVMDGVDDSHYSMVL